MKRINDLTHDLGRLPKGTVGDPPPASPESAGTAGPPAFPSTRKPALDVPGLLVWMMVACLLVFQGIGLLWLARYV